MIFVGQFVIGDVFDLTLTNWKGDEIKSELLNSFNQESLNLITGGWVNATRFDSIIDVITAFSKAAEIFGEFLLLLSGTHIFLITYYMLGGGGVCCDNDDVVATFIVGGFFLPYALMLGNTIIAKIRGI